MRPGDLRRLIHASTVVLALPALWSPAAFRLITVYVAVTAVIVEVLRLRIPALRVWLARAVPVYRDPERERPSGAMWLTVGYAIAAQLPLPAGVAGLCAGALADPAGALAGTRFGGGRPKSVVGSAAVAVVAAAGVWTLGLGPLPALAGGLAGAAVERWAGPLDDNLLVAPTVAAVAALLA